MKLEFTQAHALDLATLRARASARIEHYNTQFPSLALAQHFRWDGDRRASGSYRGGSGSISLGEREVHVELDVPFFARPFRARIEDFVRRELALTLQA